MNELDLDIFSSDVDAEKNIRENAEAQGINPDLVASSGRQYSAKKNCRRCHGAGQLTIVVSPANQKIKWINKGPKNYKRGKGQPTPQQRKQIVGFFQGNEYAADWITSKPVSSEVRERRDASIRKLLGKVPNRTGGTSQPEPSSYKENHLDKIFCKCVRIV